METFGARSWRGKEGVAKRRECVRLVTRSFVTTGRQESDRLVVGLVVE